MVSRKLNVGVIISPGIKTGGGYQYEYMVLDILKKINQSNFGVTASLQPSGDIRLTNSDGTKTGLSGCFFF